MKSFKEYLAEYGLFEGDAEDIINAVSDYLEDKATETERNEPSATNSIQRMREAAHEVSDIMWEI